MNRKWLRGAFLLLVLLAFICNPTIRTEACTSGKGSLLGLKHVSQEDGVLNNGGRVIQVGDVVYLLLFDDPEDYDSSLLASIDIEGKLQVLIEADSRNIFYLNGRILFSSSFTSYSYDPATQKTAPISSGEICFVDDQLGRVYVLRPSWDEDKRDGLYSMDIDGSDERRIVDGECYFLARQGGIIYYYKKEGNRTNIYSMDIHGRTPILIASEASLYAGEPVYMSEIPPDITEFGICDDRILYSFGYFEGSAAMFYGNISSIKKNGEDKKVIGPVPAHEFSISDGWLYRNYWNEDAGTGTGESMGAQRIRCDFSYKENLLSGMFLSRVQSGCDFILFESGMASNKPDLFIGDTDGSNARALVKGTYYHVELKEGDYLNFGNIEIVGDWVYLDAQVWGFRGNYGWRDEMIYGETNRVRLDGTGFMTLQKIATGK